MTPPAPEIGCPPPSNMRERLTAKRARFGQKPPGLGSGALMVVVAALALPVRPPAASATVAQTVWRASRRLRFEGFCAGLIIRDSVCFTRLGRLSGVG